MSHTKAQRGAGKQNASSAACRMTQVERSSTAQCHGISSETKNGVRLLSRDKVCSLSGDLKLLGH